MIIYDASQFPVNPGFVGVGKNNLVYMTETVNGVPPALLEPYEAGDAAYLAGIGAELDYIPSICVDIEYLPQAPQTIVWWNQNPAYRQTSNDLRVDWVNKFRVGYTGLVGWYGETPDWLEFARKTVQGFSQAEIDAEYAIAMQYAIDVAPMINNAAVVYPSFYLDYMLPGEPGERPFDERMEIWRLAVDSFLNEWLGLYPNKQLEFFINHGDLDARLSHLSTKGFPVNIWSGGAGQTSFSQQEVDTINYWAAFGEPGEPGSPGQQNITSAYPSPYRRFRPPPTGIVVVPPDPPPSTSGVYEFEDGSIREFEDGSIYEFENP